MKVYVASSWRNDKQPMIVEWLRSEGHDVYDFRNPTPDDCGFQWSEIDEDWESWSCERYTSALQHPIAQNGFDRDFAAMKWADVCVLLLPCGRSAHLEAGYFVGAQKPLIILLEQIEPELMYSMANLVTDKMLEVLSALEDLAEERATLKGGEG